MPQPVILLGVGPGDPDLLTVRAARALAEADVILAGEDVPAALLRDLTAEIVSVTPDEDAAKEMASRARAGLKVVRVYTGDPFDSPRRGPRGGGAAPGEGRPSRSLPASPAAGREHATPASLSGCASHGRRGRRRRRSRLGRRWPPRPARSC